MKQVTSLIFRLLNCSHVISMTSSPFLLAGTSIGTKRSLITLYHDTITGVRSAMLNYEEIPGTLGNSSLLMEKGGHQLSFLVDHRPAYIEIKRKGWMGLTFTYQCYIDGILMPEATSKVAHYDKSVFTVSLNGTVTTPDRTGQVCRYYHPYIRQHIY